MKERLQKWGALGFIFTSIVFLGAGCVNEPEATATTNTNSAQAEQEISVTLNIDFGEAEVEGTVQKKFEVKGAEAATVAGVMEDAKAGDFVYQTKTMEGVGEYVTSIMNIESTDSAFWSLYINNKMATEGMSTQTVAEGDVIEWKLETF